MNKTSKKTNLKDRKSGKFANSEPVISPHNNHIGESELKGAQFVGSARELETINKRHKHIENCNRLRRDERRNAKARKLRGAGIFTISKIDEA